MKSIYKALFFIALIGHCYADANHFDMRGNIAVNGRYFFQKGINEQENQAISLSLSPEFSYQWNDNADQIVLSLFGRVDQKDAQRTHSDIGEAYWLHAQDDWILKLGVGKVFWGVVESQHLVDIINQTDNVEGVDGEDKLGQPMAQLTLLKEWGTLDLFWLPYFRERSFPGKEGRFRGPFLIDNQEALYQSSAKQQHQDFALRWNKQFAEMDIAVSYFDGTNRNPDFVSLFNQQGLKIVPFYSLIQQLGLELQMTQDDWLWKLETVSRREGNDNYFALSGGFEYTQYGVFQTQSDLGYLVEYHFDDRHDKSKAVFDKDVFFGMRWALNDEDSSTLLAGVLVDMDNQGHSFSMEASKRLSNHLSINAEMRFFDAYPPTDAISILNQDDFAEIELIYSF